MVMLRLAFIVHIMCKVGINIYTLNEYMVVE